MTEYYYTLPYMRAYIFANMSTRNNFLKSRGKKNSTHYSTGVYFFCL